MPAAEEQIIHRLLTAIEDDAGISQRRLSLDIGIAVGSVNWYLKRCLTKGLVKLQRAPVRRYLYYLTPQGFEEKSRLTSDFLQRSLELYRRGRGECTEIVRTCAAEGKLRVFLAGDGDLAEIACLSSLGTSVQIKAVIDSATERASCAGVPVFKSLAEATAATGGEMPDAIVLTELARPRRSYSAIAQEARMAGLAPETIRVPRVLNFKPESTPEPA